MIHDLTFSACVDPWWSRTTRLAILDRLWGGGTGFFWAFDSLPFDSNTREGQGVDRPTGRTFRRDPRPSGPLRAASPGPGGGTGPGSG